MTAPPEVAALMTACTPVDVQGPAIRDGLLGRGWLPVSMEDRRNHLAAFGAAHFWSFMPGLPPADREARFDYLIDGVEGAASTEGSSFLEFDGEYALLLWNGDSLSCIWAGPQTRAIDTLAVQLGGFPQSDGVATAAVDQRVEAGGREWARRMSVGRTPVSDLPAAVSDRAITDAARLDRSPL
tara:strand:- start:683 stop:1231 length:549 start_codon:yes stop_codon:yes gene_type:complete